MSTFVADTHAIVWHLTNPRKLGRGARRAFTAADSGRWMCHVPIMALVEVALLHERGRLRVGLSQVLDAIAAHPGYAVLALDIEQSMEFAALPIIKDPIDRLMVAAARALGARLVSVDERLSGFGVERVWD